ncbi:MAG: heat-inducible transcription repressor HrcA [Gemmatimonadetes bacterium]|nr:heat-inducible transcription repressor HrcA [Gemmatimonadota bacterium]
MSRATLSEREQRVLEAVIRAYVETAEAAGSRTVAKRYRLGVSPATIRNTMADLEDKGFLYHPHTSAGRIPTDLAYRYYVDTLMGPVKIKPSDQRRLRRELDIEGERTPLERLISRAAQVLGLLTGELGIAIEPRIREAVLEKLELVALTAEKVLLVLTLKGGLIRTVYVDLPISVPPEALVSVTMILNERLAGRTLSEIRQTLPERLRDAAARDDTAGELLNIFLQSAEGIFDWTSSQSGELHLGRTSVLASQPEFASGSRLRDLIELTERRELLETALVGREHGATLKITIGSEHRQPELSPFTLVTSDYVIGNLSGVIGVIGPTRMPYEKVVSIVQNASSLLTQLLGTVVEGRAAYGATAGHAGSTASPKAQLAK